MSQAISATVRVARHSILSLVSPSYRRVRRRLRHIEALPYRIH